MKGVDKILSFWLNPYLLPSSIVHITDSTIFLVEYKIISCNDNLVYNTDNFITYDFFYKEKIAFRR